MVKVLLNNMKQCVQCIGLKFLCIFLVSQRWHCASKCLFKTSGKFDIGSWGRCGVREAST
jgi:hypothetical protein